MYRTGPPCTHGLLFRPIISPKASSGWVSVRVWTHRSAVKGNIGVEERSRGTRGEDMSKDERANESRPGNAPVRIQTTVARTGLEEIFRCSRHGVPLARGDRWFFVNFGTPPAEGGGERPPVSPVSRIFRAQVTTPRWHAPVSRSRPRREPKERKKAA